MMVLLASSGYRLRVHRIGRTTYPGLPIIGERVEREQQALGCAEQQGLWFGHRHGFRLYVGCASVHYNGLSTKPSRTLADSVC